MCPNLLLVIQSLVVVEVWAVILELNLVMYGFILCWNNNNNNNNDLDKK